MVYNIPYCVWRHRHFITLDYISSQQQQHEQQQISDLLSVMLGQAIVLLLNTTGMDNEKILMRVSIPQQSLGANRPPLTEKKDRDEERAS